MHVPIAASAIGGRRRSLALIAILAFTSTCAITSAAADGISDAERSATAGVNGEAIRKVTTDLSAPAMEGRGTAQAGGDRAAKYIAGLFLAHGIKPLGNDGTFFQPVRFHSVEVLPESRLSVRTLALLPGKDFAVAVLPPRHSFDLTGAIVFATFGVVSPELKRDDFANLDLQGKVAMIITGRPKNVDEGAWKKSGGVQAAVSALGSRGAAAVLVVADSGSYDSIADRYGRRRVELADTNHPSGPPVLYLNPGAVAQILEGSGTSLGSLRERAETGEPASRELGLQMAVSLRVDGADGTSNNVAGVIRGSDPKLNAEAVVFTAHYDAYGVARDGRIYPGAADNALGVGEMIAVAGAVAHSGATPRRTLIFLAVTGEEYGMLGSRHWVEHPSWPLAKIAANINFDGVGTEIYGKVKQVAGFGGEYSDLGEVLREVAGATGTEAIPDPVPDQGIFYRSDHYSFAKKGIPPINILGGPGGDTKVWLARVFEWVETSYHQPGDVIGSDWDWDGPRTVAVIGLLIGLRVANGDRMPNWLPSAPFKREK